MKKTRSEGVTVVALFMDIRGHNRIGLTTIQTVRLDFSMIAETYSPNILQTR